MVAVKLIEVDIVSKSTGDKSETKNLSFDLIRPGMSMPGNLFSTNNLLKLLKGSDLRAVRCIGAVFIHGNELPSPIFRAILIVNWVMKYKI
jgi:hypothetical protein